MKITLNTKCGIKPITITDEHAASSYGIPVALVDGDTYGPGDVLAIWPDDEFAWLQEPAARTVLSAARDAGISGEALDLCHRFAGTYEFMR